MGCIGDKASVQSGEGGAVSRRQHELHRTLGGWQRVAMERRTVAGSCTSAWHVCTMYDGCGDVGMECSREGGLQQSQQDARVADHSEPAAPTCSDAWLAELGTSACEECGEARVRVAEPAHFADVSSDGELTGVGRAAGE